MTSSYFLLVFLLHIAGGPVDYRTFPVSDLAACKVLEVEMRELILNNASTADVATHCIEVKLNPEGVPHT